jgi:hypothetical protein
MNYFGSKANVSNSEQKAEMTLSEQIGQDMGRNGEEKDSTALMRSDHRSSPLQMMSFVMIGPAGAKPSHFTGSSWI